MRQTPHHLACAALLLSMTLPGMAAGQETGDVDLQAGFADRVSVAYILVPVIARGKGGYVDNLVADDFELKVDGMTVPFESFDVGDSAPVSIIFLQDLSGSMANADKLRFSRLAVEQILNGAQTGDQFALASFADNHLSLDISYTDDTEVIDTELGTWSPYGVTALHDAVSGLPALTQDRQSAKRAAILITDGADNASALSPSAAREQVRQADLPVYVLGLSTGDPQSLARDGQKLHRYADILNLLAHLTGGEYFWVTSVQDAIHASSIITADLRHQYVLGFSTSDESDIAYREIEVTTRKKKVQLSFRRGYRGPPPRVQITIAR
jgi:Ca-activated chloride channel family protein